MSAPTFLLHLRRWGLRVPDRLAWLPPALARFTVGLIFLQTGWGKLHDLGHVTQFFTKLGIPAPGFNAVLVASTELVGGTLLLIGLFTRLAALPLIISMIVAILTAKRGDISELGDLLRFEEFMYIVLFVWLAVAGPGPLSLDWLIVRWLGPSTPVPDTLPRGRRPKP